MPGSSHSPSTVSRELTAQFAADVFCRAVQVAAAGVIAQPGPQVQHLVLARRGQRLYARECLHKALEVGDNRFDLGLLQHDFRHPDPVGAGVMLPGQVLAPVPVEPCRARGSRTGGGLLVWRA